MLHAMLAAALSGFATYQPAPLSPPIPHPRVAVCRVTLFRNVSFAGDAPRFTPYEPACPGPWSAILLRLETRIRGTQYDRIGAIWLDRVELLRFSTAEPTKHGITYAVEKDLSAYAPLFRRPGFVTTELANYVSKRYDGVYRLTATLSFYRTARNAPAAKSADAIVPVDDELSAQPWSTNGRLRTIVAGLPRNIVRAQLDLYATNHGCDEFWYTNVPDAYAAKHRADGLCGGGTYRQIDVAIDGKAAYVAYPFPYIWTGGINPLLWRPLSSIDALNVPPYRVDLNPWAGVLSDGKAHRIDLVVEGSRGTWPIDANLLLWRDPLRAHTSGRVLHDEFGAPRLFTVDRLGAGGGTFAQNALASWHVRGFVDGSAGRVTYDVRARMQFENRQVLNLATGLQNATQSSTVHVVSARSGPRGSSVRKTTLHYPLTANATSPSASHSRPYALVIVATVRQGRVIATDGESCSASVDARAVLKRLPSGRNAVAAGETRERNVCTGPARRFSLDRRARNGALIR